MEIDCFICSRDLSLCSNVQGRKNRLSAVRDEVLRQEQSVEDRDCRSKASIDVIASSQSFLRINNH